MASQDDFQRTRPSNTHNKRSTSCLCLNRSQKVAPAEPRPPGSHMLLVSTDRRLHLRHVNPRPRNPTFHSQMQSFIQHHYRVGSATRPHRRSAGSSRLSRLSTTQKGPYNGSSASIRNVKEDSSLELRKTSTAKGVRLIVDTPPDSTGTDMDQQDDVRKTRGTVFLIHGVGSSSDIWKAQVDFLEARGFEVIIPDLIGHGFSSAPKQPPAYLFHRIAQDMLYIFDTYCKETNIVIGHSYGGSFASFLARERASLVSHLVLISGGSPTPLAPQPGLFSWPVCCLSGCRPLLETSFKRNAFHNQPGQQNGMRDRALDVPTYVMRDRALDVPTYVMKHMMNGQLWKEGTFEYHSQISASTLIIHGKHDGLINMEDEVEMSQAIAGSELLEVDKASHMVMIEQPEIVNERIYHFLLKKNKPLASS